MSAQDNNINPRLIEAVRAATDRQPYIFPDKGHAGMPHQWGGYYNPDFVSEQNRVRAALEFYADPENWDGAKTFCGDCGWQLAQAALGKVSELKLEEGGE